MLNEIPGIRRSPHSKIAFTLSTLVPWNATCHLLNTSKAVARWWTLQRYIEHTKRELLQSPIIHMLLSVVSHQAQMSGKMRRNKSRNKDYTLLISPRTFVFFAHVRLLSLHLIHTCLTPLNKRHSRLPVIQPKKKKKKKKTPLEFQKMGKPM